MRRTILAAFVASLLLPSALFAHSGGLDRHGCHRETATGGYHCHRGSSSSGSGSSSSGSGSSSSGSSSSGSGSSSSGSGSGSGSSSKEDDDSDWGAIAGAAGGLLLLCLIVDWVKDDTSLTQPLQIVPTFTEEGEAGIAAAYLLGHGQRISFRTSTQIENGRDDTIVGLHWQVEF